MKSSPLLNWVPVEEIAADAHVSIEEVLKWITVDRLPARKYKSGWRVYKKTLKRWLDARGQPNVADRQEKSSIEASMRLVSSLSSSAPVLPVAIGKDPDAGVHLFARALMKDALTILPSLPNSESLEELRQYVRNNISYNSVQTRERFASYILKHLFPLGIPDTALISFAKKFPNSTALKEVCLYRFMCSQPLMRLIMRDVLYPALGQGFVPKARVQQYLSDKFPTAKTETLKSTISSVCEVLTSCSVAQVDKSTIRFGMRVPSIESFAFVLHSELPLPAIHDLRVLETNEAFNILLWNTEKLNRALYELRNRGLITKVSDIDTVRQFCTTYSLEEIVELLEPIQVYA